MVTPSDGDALAEHAWTALVEGAGEDYELVTVDIDGDVATLRGTIRSFRSRWSLEYALLQADGIRQVINQIVVRPPQPRPATVTTGGATGFPRATRVSLLTRIPD